MKKLLKRFIILAVISLIIGRNANKEPVSKVSNTEDTKPRIIREYKSEACFQKVEELEKLVERIIK